jgi:hypothetical protein
MPVLAHGFFEVCLPIGLVLLAFVLAWPAVIFYELFGVQEPQMMLMALLGFTIDMILLYFVGKWFDRHHVYTPRNSYKSYSFKLPFLFLTICILAAGSMFIDTSC